METAAATPEVIEEELTNTQKWMWVIGLTGAIYFLLYKVR
jgi:hypothetical protein